LYYHIMMHGQKNIKKFICLLTAYSYSYLELKWEGKLEARKYRQTQARVLDICI